MKFRLCITGDLGFEFWQDIPNYEGLLKGSTYGNLKSLDRVVKSGNHFYTVRGKILQQQTNITTGYAQVSIQNGGKKSKKTFNVHRLIATTFLPSPLSNQTDVNHKDTNRRNNRIENLEWCTRQYNINYADCRDKIASYREKPVLQFDMEGNLINKFKSPKKAGEKLGYDRNAISNCCRGHSKSSYGYIWKYEDAAI